MERHIEHLNKMRINYPPPQLLTAREEGLNTSLDAGDETCLVECLPHVYTVLGFIPEIMRRECGGEACHPSTLCKDVTLVIMIRETGERPHPAAREQVQSTTAKY